MQSSKLINMHSLILVFIALAINLIFFFTYYKKNDYYLGLLAPHGEIAYNVYRYNSVKINPERARVIGNQQQELERVVDYAEIDHEKYGPPTQYRSVQDTIWYGLTLGLLWKVTGSLQYLDMQIVQIILFSLFMLLIYSFAFMAFGDKRIALWCGAAHLFFLPLFYLNVQAMRDIWAYYGVLVLLWSIAAYLYYQRSSVFFFLASLFVAFCQLIRPMVICNVAAAVCVIAVAAILQKTVRSRSYKAIAILIATNLVVFWLPFSTYNKIAYDRYFVGPTGQWLIEGTGEFDNPWGYKLDDAWFGNYMKEKYNLSYSDAACDEQAKAEFLEKFKENPGLIFRNMARRLKDVVLPAIPWNNISNPTYKDTYPNFWQKLKAKLMVPFTSQNGFIDFFGRQIFMRLFLLLGYLGALLMLIRRQYFYVALIAGVGILPAYNCIQSHVEYRYIIPFFGFFSLFAGYAIYQLKLRLNGKHHEN